MDIYTRVEALVDKLVGAKYLLEESLSKTSNFDETKKN